MINFILLLSTNFKLYVCFRRKLTASKYLASIDDDSFGRLVPGAMEVRLVVNHHLRHLTVFTLQPKITITLLTVRCTVVSSSIKMERSFSTETVQYYEERCTRVHNLTIH